MRRVAILAILALIFLTVTGITVAQERTSAPERGDQKEAAVQEPTSKKSAKDSDRGLANRNETTARTRAQNPDNPEAKKRKAAEGKTAKGESEDVGETEDSDRPPDKGRPAGAGKSSGNGKPESVDKAANAGGGKPDSVGKAASKPAGADKTEDAGNAKGKGWAKGKGNAKGKGEAEGGSGQGKKVTVCHVPPDNPANAHEISISENAWPAHQSHGDKLGACE